MKRERELSPLARDNEEARKAGLNYGMYKALQYEGDQKRLQELIQRRGRKS